MTIKIQPHKVNINFFLKQFGYGREYIYSGKKSALVQFASLSQEKELADYDDLWHGSDCSKRLKTTTKCFGIENF